MEDRRQAQALAHKLLMLCKCCRCEQIIRDPVTLPCGHSSCLSCIVAMTSTSSMASISKTLPSTTHLPPRLPLSSTTVPCPIDGCPRSAIGQGMGIWSGHKAIYGPRVNTDVMEWPTLEEEQGEERSSIPGPLDGFVAPQNQERNLLTVIPAQLRSSYLEKYAISKYTIESCTVTQEAGLLRPDVTLSKTLELLRRYAQSPVEPSLPLPRRIAAAARLHGRGNHSDRQRRSRRIRALHNQEKGSSHHPAGTRTEINSHFLTALGVSEKGMETGAVGGIRATWDSDDEESHEYGHAAHRTSRFWNVAREEEEAYSTAAEDDQDDEIGGAFARQYTPPVVFSGNKDSSRISSASDKSSSLPKLLTPELLHSELLDDLECQLCYMLLYQPLTTPCGHTFCRQCFARSLDHSSTCPLCRADMPSFAFFQEHPSNNIVFKLLTAEWAEVVEKDEMTIMSSSSPLPSVPSESKASLLALRHLGFKQLYQNRQITMEREARESLLSTPLFVCTLAFPHMPTILHIFEPRYRLMIRRCLESGYARFGMVLHSSDTTGPVPGMSRYGTMLDIKTVQMLPDGRSMIETVGSHRFRVLERGSLDGYTVGQIERIDDVDAELEDELERSSLGVVDSNATPSVLAEAREAQAAFQAAIGIDFSRGEEQQQQQQQASNVLDNFAQRNTSQLVQVCIEFIETLQSGSAPWLMTRLNNTYGPMPKSSDVAAFGYWMALVMPIDEHEKSKLLPIRSARLRLRIVVYWIEQLRQTWWFNHGCSVQ